MKRRQEERRLQRAVNDLLAIYERQGKLNFAAVPNGEKRDKVTGAILKGQGVRAGFPDMIVILPSRVLFWELKSPVGRLRVDQELWRQAIERQGHSWSLIRSLSDAEACLKKALGK